MRFDDETYEQWRAAYEAGTIEPELIEFVAAVAGAAAGGGALPNSLSPRRQWDAEALAETVQEWWAQRLLDGPTLRQAFHSARSARAFSRYLEKALRNWLIDRARASGAPRLRTRTEKLLREKDQFKSYGGTGATELWGLAAEGWDKCTPYRGDDTLLTAEIYALGDFELLKPVSGGTRANAVIGNEELARLLEGLFARVEAYLNIEQLSRAIRQRFISAYPPGVTYDENQLAELPDPAVPLADVIDARETARRILAMLSGRQLELVIGRHLRNQTLDALAREHGCSRGTADNELKRAAHVMREEIDTPDDLAAVWKELLEMTS